MRYGEYLRKSRMDDPHEPLEETLRRHREILKKFAVEHNIPIAEKDIYEEVVSGDSLYARPQMLRLLEDVATGKFDGILCMDIQRLGRGSMSDQGIILEAFKSSGTKIITPVKTYDLNDESDETYTEFEAFMGRQELKMIKRRLRRGLKKTIEDGGYVANAPYGYEKAKIGKRPTLKINEEEANFVRLMFDLYANKNMGCQQIADAVNRMGAKPHRAAQFGRTAIRQILTSPVYLGKIVWDRVTYIHPGMQGSTKHGKIYNPKESWTVVDGLHPAIIDEDTFYRVQEIFANRYHSPSFKGYVENPLAGLVICSNCGAAMQRQMCKGGPILLCQKRGCIVSSRLALVEQEVLRRLREEIGNLSAMQAVPVDEDDHAEEVLKSIEREIRTAKQQDSRLHDLLEQGVYDADTFLARHQILLDRIEKLKDSKLPFLQPKKQLNIPAMQMRIQDVLDHYPNASGAAKNEMLKSVIEHIDYRKRKGAKPAEFELDIYFLPLYVAT